MFAKSLLSLLAVYGASASPVPQGPNTVAANNPTLRTMSVNGTWTVIPMNIDVVQALVAPKKLVPIQANTARYPKGWPKGTHPVVVSGTYSTYIEMLDLEIPNSLMAGQIRVPCVDQLGDGKTCFNVAITDFIGGTNGQLLPAAVPALVGSAEGTTIHPGVFYPSSAAVSEIGGGQFTFQVDADLVPNPVSGPAVAPNAFSYTLHKTSSSPLLTASGFHFFISQTLVQNNGMCQNNAYYFNESFARPFFAAGQTTLFNQNGLNFVPTSIAGTFTNGTSYSGNAESVGYNPQSCADAAASQDPAAIN